VEVEERFSKNSESSAAMAAGPALPLPVIVGSPTAEDELEAEVEEEIKGNPSSSLFWKINRMIIEYNSLVHGIWKKNDLFSFFLEGKVLKNENNKPKQKIITY
jgi:hypothetical protein